jgi:hypothetical protein
MPFVPKYETKVFASLNELSHIYFFSTCSQKADETFLIVFKRTGMKYENINNIIEDN